jgi:PAS domain S-box-containing protein
MIKHASFTPSGAPVGDGRRGRGDAWGRRLTDSWFRSLVDQSLVGVYVVMDGSFVYVNPTFAELFGYTAEEVLRGKRVLDLVDPVDRALVRENIRKRLEGEVESIRYTFRGLRSDGSRIDVEVHGTRTEIGGEPAVVGLLVDVSDRNRARQELERLYGEARDAVQARDEVLAVVSHDLRNPLNAIGMSVDLLRFQLGAGADPTVIAALERVRRLVRNMDILIRDLLDVSAMEAGSFTIERKPREVREVVDLALDMLEPSAAEKGVELVVEAPGAERRVACDRDRLLQVLSNLLGNAIKFTPSGGRVRLGVESTRDAVLVSVHDSGPGIPEEHLPNLFDRFWKRGSLEGAGLGLAIAKGIVEAHGGRIWVESEVGRGTAFYFTVPQSSPRSAVVGRPSSGPRVGSGPDVENPTTAD